METEIYCKNVKELKKLLTLFNNFDENLISKSRLDNWIKVCPESRYVRISALEEKSIWWKPKNGEKIFYMVNGYKEPRAEKIISNSRKHFVRMSFDEFINSNRNIFIR